MFPKNASAQVHAFDVRLAGGLKPPELLLYDLRDALEDKNRLALTKVPPSLDTMMVDQWRWFYLDGSGPISVDRYLCWGVRFWTKKVPSELINSMVDEKVAQWRLEHTTVDDDGKEKVPKCPRSVKDDFKEAVRTEITQRTPPNIYDNTVLYDAEDARLYLFDCSGSVLDARLGSVKALLRRAWKQKKDVVMTERTTAHYFGLTRAESHLPTGVSEHYLSWMARQGLEGRWHALLQEDGPTTQVSISVGQELRVRNEDKGKIRIEGEDAVVAWMQDDHNADMPVTHGKFEISHYIEGHHNVQRYLLTLDTDGVRKIGVIDSTTYTGDPEDSVLLRANDYKQALAAWETTLVLFDNLYLTDLMMQDPQEGLWPHLINAQIRTIDDVILSDIDDKDGTQPSLFERLK